MLAINYENTATYTNLRHTHTQIVYMIIIYNIIIIRLTGPKYPHKHMLSSILSSTSELLIKQLHKGSQDYKGLSLNATLSKLN